MIQLVAVAFFLVLLAGLGAVLQFTLREHWDDMVSALLGRPMRRHRVSRRARIQASVPRSRRAAAV